MVTDIRFILLSAESIAAISIAHPSARLCRPPIREATHSLTRLSIVYDSTISVVGIPAAGCLPSLGRGDKPIWLMCPLRAVSRTMCVRERQIAGEFVWGA
jgi:hypothetical protein